MRFVVAVNVALKYDSYCTSLRSRQMIIKSRACEIKDLLK